MVPGLPCAIRTYPFPFQIFPTGVGCNALGRFQSIQQIPNKDLACLLRASLASSWGRCVGCSLTLLIARCSSTFSNPPPRPEPRTLSHRDKVSEPILSDRELGDAELMKQSVISLSMQDAASGVARAAAHRREGSPSELGLSQQCKSWVSDDVCRDAWQQRVFSAVPGDSI